MSHVSEHAVLVSFLDWVNNFLVDYMYQMCIGLIGLVLREITSSTGVR